QNLGNWFLRPVATSYFHDFKTAQNYVPPSTRSRVYSYENYMDRQEVSGGLGVGYQVAKVSFLTLGYRYGGQDQFKGPYGTGGATIDSPFDSAYHRVLLGAEGSPVHWLKLNLCFGPDVREFNKDAEKSYPAFAPHELIYYVDASLSFFPSAHD